MLYYLIIITGRKLSLSADSIDSESMMSYIADRQHHLVSAKSIFKKTEGTQNTYFNDSDGDKEQLILDNDSPNMNSVRIRQTPFFASQVLGALLRTNNNVEQLSPIEKTEGKRIAQSITNYIDTPEEKITQTTATAINKEHCQSVNIRPVKTRKILRRSNAERKKASSGSTGDSPTDTTNRLPYEPQRRGS